MENNKQQSQDRIYSKATVLPALNFNAESNLPQPGSLNQSNYFHRDESISVLLKSQGLEGSSSRKSLNQKLTNAEENEVAKAYQNTNQNTSMASIGRQS